MDYTKSPRSELRDTPFGSGIHHKASRENDVRDNVMVGNGVCLETCIRDKDLDPGFTYPILGFSMLITWVLVVTILNAFTDQQYWKLCQAGSERQIESAYWGKTRGLKIPIPHIISNF